MKTIGERIKDRRIQLAMTQVDLAKKVGYAHGSTVAKIEAGERDLKESQVVAFAEALYCTPQFLMGWEEQDSEEEKRALINKAFDERPEMRTLFSLASDASKEDVEKAIKIFEMLKGD